MGVKYDFCGWATKNDVRCTDGRIIRKDAFKDCDGIKVPLVWNHRHDDGEHILGHAILENRPEGVYAYCSFNPTEAGKKAKILVQHGDIDQLSIYANKLKEQAQNVMHGFIKEVSLVIAGANPEAYIETVLSHGAECEGEAIIHTDEYIVVMDNPYVEHSQKDVVEEEAKKSEVEDAKDSESDDTKKSEEDTDKKPESEEDKKDMDEEKGKKIEHAAENTVEEVYNTLNDNQKNLVDYLVGKALDSKDGSSDKPETKNDAEAKHSDDEEDENKGGSTIMKHNVFNTNAQTEENTLSHSDVQAIFADAKHGSLRDAVIAHGITDIDFLFPEAQKVSNTPDFIKREDDWVSKVMNSVHHTPFSRVKSVFADITADAARAKGYVKGNLKIEEVLTLLKRTTTPTTVYKKQKLDRDDVIDITDFDVVAWLKSEMRIMLDEELARAFLIGDGRSGADDEKINVLNIRPIWTDADLYTIKSTITVAPNATADARSKAFIRAAVKSRKNYKGSGNPFMFTTEDVLTDCLLMEDLQGRVIYDTIEKLTTALRVKEIITVPVMEDLSRVDGATTYNLLGIIVNLIDYNVGADKGGAINMFDDFDIDFNAQKYLIETRCSGALIKPYSAIALEVVETVAAG